MDGIFFSSFFGGSSASDATPKDVYIDFDDFEVSTLGQVAKTTDNISASSDSTTDSLSGGNILSAPAGINSAFS